MAKKKVEKPMKKSNKLRRTILGTLSGVFMISALIVAAIPVKSVEAEGEAGNDSFVDDVVINVNYDAVSNDHGIPEYLPNDPYDSTDVYFSSDGRFGVKQVDGDGRSVLIYYNSDTELNGAALTIYNEMDAYRYEAIDIFLPPDNTPAKENQLRAIGENGEFLSYLKEEPVSGNTIDIGELLPCYASNQSEWSGKILYDSKNGTEVQKQKKLTIRYIGSTRYILEKPTYEEYKGHFANGGETTSIFAGANIGRINIPENIYAIGDDAFKGCQMTDISITGGNLRFIGNHAFEGCNRLVHVNVGAIADDGGVGTGEFLQIGAYAFSGCAYLERVELPDQVTTIGSGCFMGCRSLGDINLYGSGNNGNTSLVVMGNGAFYGCKSLKNIQLPNKLSVLDKTHWFYGCEKLEKLTLPLDNSGEFLASNVTGCKALREVTVQNANMDIQCDHSPGQCKGDIPNCTFGKLNLGVSDSLTAKEDLEDYFCIITPSRESAAYKYACRHEYTLKWADENVYEKVQGNYLFVIQENNDYDVGNGLIPGELIRIQTYNNGNTGDDRILDIPEKAGGIPIVAIDGKFLGKDKEENSNIKNALQYVYIPESVGWIEGGAFNYCENLAEVEFENAMNVNVIESGAFYTGTTNKGIELHFVGTISDEISRSEPFMYAMNTANNYNDPSITSKHISYISPFPSNLVVKLDGGRPTLVSVPDFEDDFKTGTYSKSANPGFEKEQNQIVHNAWIEYTGVTLSGNSYDSCSDNTKAVLKAIFEPEIPEGVYNMKEDVFKGNEYITGVTLNSVTDVPDEAFAGCKNLSYFRMDSSGVEGGERIGAHAFLDDTKLTTVILPETLNTMDSVPFFGCTDLKNVNFVGNPKFYCNDAIIYENKDDGTRKIVECLQARGVTYGTSTVSEEEFANVSEIADGAFENCKGIKITYFGEAPLTDIPQDCFKDCTSLFLAELSKATEYIGPFAFYNTALSGIKIPGENTVVADKNAFSRPNPITGEDELMMDMTIECPNPSATYTLLKRLGFNIGIIELETVKAEFYGYMGSPLLETQIVIKGGDAVPPEPPEIDGMRFTNWFPSDFTNLIENTQFVAQYTDAPPEEDNRPIYTVTFYNHDGTKKVSTQRVREGDGAKAPTTVPEREGYTFVGWLPEFDNIVEDTDIYAQYKIGNATTKPNDPTNSGSQNNPPGGGANPSNPNGSPGGSNDPAKPNGSSTGNGSNSSGGSTVSGNRTNGSNRTNNRGTIVSVNKTGISNPGLVSAVVNGSSDDYVVKITDSEAARSAVEQALLNEYGTLDDIRYFAMDISLYDKTGTTKIQNTDGISVTITMPIPDALVNYAGNNKAGAVVGNNTLEKLQTRFTTIDGVPCISFVATHFSPYTIYVDLNNMSANGGVIDATPVTGDPIHPKWFLSIGLALMSIMMFFMKGSKRTVVKVISG